jgi:tyrosyl-tRNA synthetase
MPLNELAEVKAALAAGGVNPRDLKMRLAREIVEQYHGAPAAGAAEAAFIRQFVQRELPADIPEYALNAPEPIVDLLVNAKLAASKGEARRLIDGGGVRINGEKVEGYDVQVEPGSGTVVQVGRRKFVRIG